MIAEHARRGFALLELLVAGVLIATAMVVTVHLLGWLVAEHRAAERRQWAIQEAANVMERLTAQDWWRVTPERARAVRLSSQARQVLPGAALAVTVTTRAGEPALKRIAVEVRWRAAAGEPAAPVRLTSWIARRGRGER